MSTAEERARAGQDWQAAWEARVFPDGRDKLPLPLDLGTQREEVEALLHSLWKAVARLEDGHWSVFEDPARWALQGVIVGLADDLQTMTDAAHVRWPEFVSRWS